MKSQFPFGARHQRTSRHLQACHECAASVRRDRQYLERLRDAPIPPASQDLTERLLSRTSELAAQPVLPARTPAPRTAARALAITAGGTVAAAGVLAAGAFAAAGDPLAGTASGSTAAFSHVSAQTPADGRTLNAEQVGRLRSEGWACPELEAMGFHLEAAKALVVEGQPAVELRLTDGSHHATITEQHATPQAAGAAAAGGGGSSGDGLLQVWGTSPWSATYRTAGRTFTYRSDLPADQADDAIAILRNLARTAAEGVDAATPQSSPGVSGEPLAARLERGINRIAALFAP
ncbi:MAG: anti-sigma factor [Pseudarthrobacter sp.]|nr:anti-sigma factor [Pseudarthrobacter sp.]